MAKIKFSKILFLITIEIATLCISVNGAYLGCYKETFPLRVFNRNPGALGKSPLTPQTCYTLCGGLGHSYAALGFGRFCFCSDTSPDVALTKDTLDTKCTLGCPGDPLQKCGSTAYVSVYSTPRPVDLTISAAPKIVAVGDTVVLASAVQPSGIGFDLRVDFDDNAGRTEYAENGTNILQRTFLQAGEYEIRSYVTDMDTMLPDVESATSVVVESIPDGVTVDCPPSMATYQEDVCFIKVTRGTNMNLEISYTDGNPGVTIVENIQIADSMEYSLGNFVQEHMLAPEAHYTSGTSTSGLIIHYGNPAQFKGQLVGFEYYGVGTGALDFHVYRPSCGAQMYCYETNTCENTCDVTCGVEGFCMDTGRCCGSPISRHSGLLNSYTHVHTISANIVPGYGYQTAPPDLYIQPGDVIAHDGKATPLIANSVPDVPIGTEYDSYCSGLIAPAVFTFADCTLTTEVHQLKAIFSDTSETMYPLEFTMPGNVTFQASVSNLDQVNIPHSAIVASTFIGVVEGVNATILNVPVYAPLNTPTLFSVEPYTGSPANIAWNFDPTPYDGIDLISVSHTFTNLGSHNLTVNISNFASFQVNFTTIYVEEQITGLTLTTPVTNVEVDVSTNIVIGMATGSDYVCDFEFLYADGTDESVQITEADGLNFDHVFNIAGDVTIDINCTNNLSTTQISRSIRAVERLTNVALTPPGAVAGEFFNFMLTWDAGTDITLNYFTYDGISIDMALNESLRHATSVSEEQETIPGSHTVSYELTNPFGTLTVPSANFVIEIEITNAVIDCIFQNQFPAVPGSPYIIIALNTGVDCTVDMDAGTSVAIDVDYDDGATDNPASNTGDSWATAKPGFGFPLTHTFTTAGYYHMTVTVRNNFNSVSETYPLAVMVGVENSVMNAVAPVRFDPPAVLDFTFNIAGPIPNDVRCYIEWGDKNNDEYDPCDLTSVFTHTYLDQDGTLTLTYRLENLVSIKEDTIPVYIVTPIIGHECYTSKKAGIPGEPIDIVFKSWRAPPAGELDLTFVCDVSAPGVQTTKARQYASPDGEDTESCVYTTAETVTMSIRAVSLMEDKSCTHTFEIMNPVTEDFDVFVVSAPMDNEFNTLCEFDYSIIYNGSPIPDSAQIEIDPGDNTSVIPFTFSSSLTHPYRYASAGHYISKIRIFNDASEVTRNILTGCYASFSATTLEVKRTPTLPLGSPDEWGFGVTKNLFSGDEPIRIYPTITKGTLVWWEVSAVSTANIYSCNDTNKDVITLNIKEAGVYTIEVTPKNPVHTGPTVQYIAEIMRPVDNITITDFKLTNANEDKNFNVSMQNHGTGTCVAVHFGDTNTIELYGDAATCSDTSMPDSYFSGPNYKNGFLTDVSVPFNLLHQFKSEGTYVMQMFAWNFISNATAEFQFAVSGLDCSAPNIDIRNRCRDFRYPMTCQRSKRCKITGLTDITCPETVRNTKRWTMIQIDQATNTIIKEVNITGLKSSINSELAFDPISLDLAYGVYILYYKVTMLTPSENGEEFSSIAETYLEIVPTDITAQLFDNSMSLITVGPNSLLTLSPRTYSTDPDVDIDGGETDVFDSFAIACRDITQNETFPVESVDNEVIPMNKSDLPPGHINTGGCFQHGPGWFKNFDGSVTFWTNILAPNSIYEFKVIVRKAAGGKQRESTVFGQVHVKSGTPPMFTMDFKIPKILKTSPSGKLFNANNQLGMLANLTIPCPACSFQWKMVAYDHQFCGPDFNCWRDLPYLDRYIEGNMGAQSQELTVRTEVFNHYTHISLFQLRLEVTDGDTGISGLRILNLTRNNPPGNGNCTIMPSSGVSMHTNFSIECPNFEDAEGHAVVDYKIKCKTADGIQTVLEDTSPYWYNKLLPVGDKDNGYILKCNITVEDEYGSLGTYPIPEVTVEMMSLDAFRTMLEGMEESGNDIIDMVEAIANLADTSSFVSSLVSMVHQSSENDENEAYACQGTFMSFTSTGLNSNENRTCSFTQEEEDSEKLEQFENFRETTAKMFTQLVDTLQDVTAESPDETEQLTNTLAKMSSSKAHLTRNSQSAMTDLLQKGLENVLEYEESMSVEQMVSISQNTIDACTNIGESAALGADLPTISDLDTQNVPVQNFDSNKDSPLDDVESFTSDADALKDGKKIYNKDVQTQFTSGNLKRCGNIQDTFVELLGKKSPKSPTPIIMESASFSAAIYKNDAASLVNKTVEAGGCTVDIHDSVFPPEDADKTYLFTVTTQAAPQYVLPKNSPVGAHSRTVSVSFKDENGNKAKLKLKTPVKIKIQSDPNQPKFNWSSLPLANPMIPENRYDEVFFYHQTEVHNENAAMRLQFRLTNDTKDVQLLVLINYIDKPELDKTRSKLKYLCTIPSDTSLTGTYGSESEPDPYVCFVPAHIVANNTGKYSIAVRQLLPDELNIYKKIKDLPISVPTKWKDNKFFTTDYTSNCVEVTCPYFEDGESVAKSDGVVPNELSSETAVVCETSHFTTFAGGWAVAPNTIDWNFIFSNADFFKNPTLYITEIVIALAYIVAMIWSRRKDRQDLEKLGLTPLLDNDPRDRYYYEIMVSTGMRRGAGTDSKVHFILSGEEEETDVRTFEDKKRKILTRGSTDGFLMSVPESIGALNYLRIWHDNSGKGRTASWYLNHVVVRDVQTDKKYYFIANRWFAVEEDDGQVDRVIPVAGKEQMTEFSHLFAERATKNLSDGHLWFSVVARPPQSRFTRCQRVSCCLCLLYTSMLANAMFYGTETSDASAFQFGPFALTSEQIFIGVMANLIIFPVNFLLITLFRKSRPRKLRPSRVEEAIKSKPERTTSMADVNPRVKSSLDYERPGSSFLMETKRSQSSMSRPESSMSMPNVEVKNKKKKKKCELPWWFTIVSWILLWIAVLVSVAFVTFYGISFQDIKCKKWITSMLISFFMSVFFTQPIKVFLFAIIFSLIIKNPGGDEDDDDEEAPKRLETDEEYLHEEDEFGFVTPRKPMYKPKPPDTRSLEAARKQRLKEIQMWSVIREILFYAFFLWILLVISYRSVSTDSYDYKHNMQKVFILTNDTNKAFSKVKNANDFWLWAKSGMLRGIRAGPYYNNFPPFYMRGYINDKQSRLMGYAILRQVRTQPNTCKLPRYMEGIIDECNGGYDIADEEDGDFGPGWTTLAVNGTRDEYMYKSASSLDSFPYWGEIALYGGGGYVVKLNLAYEDMIDHFKQLESEGWVDKYTRAVFLEFTVYNPSINLFSVSTLLAEFVPTGGVFTSFRFEPCNLLPYMNSALLFQIICEIVYFGFTVYFVFKEIRCIIKQKKDYFFQFWNLVDLGICAMSVTAIVIYFYRLFCINRLTEYFSQTHGNGYMKFQYVGYWSEIFNYIIGFLVFFATLKFLKLLRFNKKISMLSDTLRNSSKDLIHFSIILNVVFLAFIQVFYLVYMSHLDIFKTFVSSCEAGIVMMMGKFDIYNMLGVNQWLTQIFIFLFVVTVTFIVVNMLLSILNDTFSAVRNDKAKQENDYEIVDFMLGRFKMWTGIGRDSTTISPTDMEERNKNYKTLEGQIDYFPDQIDRFLASISNMYMGDAKFDDFLQKGMAKKMAMKAQAQQEMSHPAPRYPGALRISHGARGMTDVQTD